MALVLLAHDSRDRVKTIPEIIDAMGHTHVLCNNQDNILTVYNRHMPDLIILDQKKAFYECERLRSTAETHDVPIIIISRLKGEADSIRALKMGANKYLTKPVNIDLLRLAISYELDQIRRHKIAEEMVAKKTIVGGRYKLSRLISIDRHSAIFLAQDHQNDDANVVLKLLRERLVLPEVIEQFTDVTSKVMGASCDSLVKILDSGEHESRPFLVMEYHKGESFSEMMTLGPLNEKEATKMALDVVRALFAMKKRGALHLDLRPDNIIKCDDGFKLTNFGLVLDLESDIFNTGFGCWGDPAYICPEYFTAEENLTARSDIYSLGLILYTALTGSNPFTNLNSEYVVYKQVLFDVPPLHEKAPSISVAFSTVVSSMLNKKPGQRPRLRELEIAFNQILMMLEVMPASKMGHSGNNENVVLAGTGDDTIDIAPNKQNKVLKDIYEDRLRREALEEDIKLNKARKVKIIFAAVIAVIVCVAAFGAGWLVFASSIEKYPYDNGPLVLFSCYNGHKHEKRTFEYTSKCPKCGQYAGQTRACPRCKRFFAISEWPHKDMTDEECIDFQKKLHICPFCRYTRTYMAFPDPVVKALKSKVKKKAIKKGRKKSKKKK
jgi:serine/threonine protein kinase/ActR/RegA family two-component response regulator